MRNFIVLFMILVLFSLIMLLITKPVTSDIENKDTKEKSHVEKLLTEQSKEEKNKNNDIQEMSSENDTGKIITDVFSETIYIKPQSNKNDPQEIDKTPQPFNKNQQMNEIQELTEKTKSDKNFQNISNELIEKYGNNPNAEVSEEDVQHYMIKMIETMQNKQ